MLAKLLKSTAFVLITAFVLGVIAPAALVSADIFDSTIVAHRAASKIIGVILIVLVIWLLLAKLSVEPKKVGENPAKSVSKTRWFFILFYAIVGIGAFLWAVSDI